jgi:uncharacterized membrane protein
MIRLLSATLIAVMLAGVVHIAAVQTVPWIAPRLPRDRLVELGAELAFTPFADKLTATDLDPAFRYAACVFDLAQGPVVIEAAPGTDYWGLSLHDRPLLRPQQSVGRAGTGDDRRRPGGSSRAARARSPGAQ